MVESQGFKTLRMKLSTFVPLALAGLAAAITTETTETVTLTASNGDIYYKTRTYEYTGQTTPTSGTYTTTVTVSGDGYTYVKTNTVTAGLVDAVISYYTLTNSAGTFTKTISTDVVDSAAVASAESVAETATTASSSAFGAPNYSVNCGMVAAGAAAAMAVLM